MTITFSGDDYPPYPKPANVEVTETITIDRTDRVLALYVRSYDDGAGRVTFQWSGAEPCPAGWGCRPCEEWICKDPLQPACDGGNNPTCETAADALTKQQQCDEGQTGNNCRDEICYPLSYPCPPTESPTVSPTSSPTKSPTLENC